MKKLIPKVGINNFNSSAREIMKIIRDLYIASVYWICVTAVSSNFLLSGDEREWRIKELIATSVSLQNVWISHRGIPEKDAKYILQLAPFMGIISSLVIGLSIHILLSRLRKKYQFAFSLIFSALSISLYGHLGITIILIAITYSAITFASSTAIDLIQVVCILAGGYSILFFFRIFSFVSFEFFVIATSFAILVWLKFPISIHGILAVDSLLWVMAVGNKSGVRDLRFAIVCTFVYLFFGISLLIIHSRRKGNYGRRNRIQILLIVSVTSLGISFYVPYQNNSNLSLDAPLNYASNCHLGKGEWIYSKSCLGEGNPDIVLVGDSHAAQWMAGVTLLAKDTNQNLLVLTKSACALNAMENPYLILEDYSCQKWNSNIMELIGKMHPRIVFVSNHTEGVYKSTNRTGSQERKWKVGLVSTFRGLLKSANNVYYIEDNVKPNFDPIQCLSSPYRDEATCSFKFSQTIQTEETSILLSRIGIRVLDVNKQICKESSCSTVAYKVNVFRDDNHLSNKFASLAFKEFEIK